MEFIWSLFGLLQNQAQNNQDIRLQAEKLLADAHAHILTGKMFLDHEIYRLRLLCEQNGIPSDIALEALFKMRGQCEALQRQHGENLALLQKTGANANAVAELTKWVALLSTMQQHVELTASLITQAILSETQQS